MLRRLHAAAGPGALRRRRRQPGGALLDLVGGGDGLRPLPQRGAAGAPFTDVDLGNNAAQNNFDNIPLMSGVAQARFFIYNHLDDPAQASLVGIAHSPGWQVRFAGIADPARIPLAPKQWLGVTAIATPAEGAPAPQRGAPILVEVSQQLEGATVGGLTIAVQPPDFGSPGGGSPAPAVASTWLGVRSGIAWPLFALAREHDAGFHFQVDLARALSPRLRLGLAAGYRAFPADTAGGADLGVRDVAVFARFLGSPGGWRPYGLVGLGAYRASFAGT